MTIAVQPKTRCLASLRPIVIGNHSNTVFGSPIPMMRFFDVSGVTVRNNFAPLQPGQPTIAVFMYHSCQLLVNGNRFPGAVKGEPRSVGTCDLKS